MIVKMDSTSFCTNMDATPEIERVFDCYQAPNDEVTYCCSATPSVFCEHLGTQLEFAPGISEERQEELEDLFRNGENAYYNLRDIERLPRAEWGAFPPQGESGCVIESSGEYEDAEDERDDFFCNGG